MSGPQHNYTSIGDHWTLVPEAKNSLLLLISLALSVIVFGTLGYLLIEDWTLLDSFYMTVITVSTVGFMEVAPLSPAGRLFTALLIIAGVGVAAYTFTTMVRLIIGGELSHIRGINKMRKEIGKLDDHIIVCGFGLLGSIVVRELVEAGQRIVVIDQDPDRISELKDSGIPFVQGVAYEDDVLKAARISTAKTLISLLPKDADSVYVTLCARELNPSLNIIARTEDEGGENRLRRAGAHQVLAPYRVAGSRIVQQLIRPHVSDFLQLAVGPVGPKLVIEEIIVPPESKLRGKTLEESALRQKSGAVVAAVVEADGTTTLSPGGDAIITPGSTLIIFGERGSLEKLSELL